MDRGLGGRGAGLNETLALSPAGNPVTSISIPMPRYLWHLDSDGWPLERIDTLTGEHVPVFTASPEDLPPPRKADARSLVPFPRSRE